MERAPGSSGSPHGLTAARRSDWNTRGKRRTYAKAIDRLDLSAACLVPSRDQSFQLSRLVSYLDATDGAEFHQFCASFDYEGFVNLALSSPHEPIVVGALACVAACSSSRRFRARDFASPPVVDRLLALLDSDIALGRESALTILACIVSDVADIADWLFGAHLSRLAALPPTVALGSLIIELTTQPRSGLHVQVVDVARGLLAQNTDVNLWTQGFWIVINGFANLPETMEATSGDIWRGIDANVDVYFQQDDAAFAKA
jgi:hypothetical protein